MSKYKECPGHCEECSCCDSCRADPREYSPDCEECRKCHILNNVNVEE